MSKEPWEERMSESRLLQLHQLGIDRYSETEEQRQQDYPAKPDCLRGAISKAFNQHLYEEGEGEDPGFYFAFILMRNIVVDHCFRDGNTRLAWLAMTDYLSTLGIDIDANEEEAEAFVKKHMSATGGGTTHEAVQWLFEKAIPIDLEEIPGRESETESNEVFRDASSQSGG